MKKFFACILLISLFQNLTAQEFSNKAWLKSGAVVGFNNLEIFKYGFKDSVDFKIYFDKIDSLKTTDSFIIKNLSDSYKALLLTKSQNATLIKGFQNLHTNAFNAAIEISGRLIAGGLSVSYIRQNKHSFDLGYGWGYMASYFSDSVNVKYLVNLSYSYLQGKGNFKGEFGGGLSIGQVAIGQNSSDGWLGEDNNENITNYSGLILSGTLGLRYQRSRSGLHFKTGVSPVIFTYPKITLKFYFYLGLGFTFVQ